MIPDIINAVPYYYLWYGVTYIYKRQYTDNTITLRKSMNMRASAERASLENVCIFTF